MTVAFYCFFLLVEDPSPEFVALRDYVDCQNARKLQCFQPHQILSPYSQEIERQCRNKLKIGKVCIFIIVSESAIALFK